MLISEIVLVSDVDQEETERLIDDAVNSDENFYLFCYII